MEIFLKTILPPKISANVPERFVISGVVDDPSLVKPGDLFVAIPRSEGELGSLIKNIEKAVLRGARAILTDASLIHEVKDKFFGSSVILIGADQLEEVLKYVMVHFFGEIPRVMVAVTGTNGKTSTADFVRQIWGHCNVPAASVGTLGLCKGGQRIPSNYTTPRAIENAITLSNLKREGVDHVVMEASSHGLYQKRLCGIEFKAAGFTNLTHDHLDYHGDMESYFEAKKILFSELLSTGGIAVLNADIQEKISLQEICLNRGIGIISYGWNQGADIHLLGVLPSPVGQQVRLRLFGQIYDLFFPLVGEFQLKNALCALGLSIGSGVDVKKAISAISQILSVPGRLEKVETKNGKSTVYVDYAHTPDALSTILRTIRPHVEGSLYLVFGCGGDRDKTKRRIMGEISSKMADKVIITDDNPRTEDPGTIRRDVILGCPDAIEIADRGEAIDTAIQMLDPKDVLIIAGKGHEKGQEINGKIYPFDDVQKVRTVLSKEVVYEGLE